MTSLPLPILSLSRTGPALISSPSPLHAASFFLTPLPDSCSLPSRVSTATATTAMSHRAESSSASRATRRQERGVSSVVAKFVAYPVGTETELPLILCPDCHLARVIELHVKQETPNKGHNFFKCPRNGNPKLCGFYRFQKAYFDEFVNKKIIRVSCEQIEGLEEEGTEDSEAANEDVKDLHTEKLEKKLEKMMSKMNFVIVCFVIVVLGVVVKCAT